MSEQTFEVTYCPAPLCVAKVKIHTDGNGEKGINYCCLNCWRWTWENGVMNSVPLDEMGEEIFHHSDQCDRRQHMRDGWKVSEQVTTLMGPSESALHKMRQGVFTHGANPDGQKAQEV